MKLGNQILRMLFEKKGDLYDETLEEAFTTALVNLKHNDGIVSEGELSYHGKAIKSTIPQPFRLKKGIYISKLKKPEVFRFRYNHCIVAFPSYDEMFCTSMAKVWVIETLNPHVSTNSKWDRTPHIHEYVGSYHDLIKRIPESQSPLARIFVDYREKE